MDHTANTPLETVCACAALRSGARSVTQLYDLVLQPSGLKTTQFIALKTIEVAGEIAQCRFARENAIAIETLSRRFAALRRHGWVSFTVGKNTERLYSLTREGKEVLTRALPYWERAQKRLRQTLGDSEFRSLLRLCEKTVDAAHAAEQLRAANSSSALSPPVPDGAVPIEQAQRSETSTPSSSHVCGSDGLAALLEVVSRSCEKVLPGRVPLPHIGAVQGTLGNHRLSSWKEIAHYAGQAVRTVQRWERELGFPVYRIHVNGRGPVFSSTADIDAWYERRREGGSRLEKQADSGNQQTRSASVN